MPIINFTMFVDKVASGEKRQTIRAIRKRPIKVGDKLYLYTCLRTTGCRSLLNSDYWTKGQGIYEMTVNDSTGESYVICKEVHDIEIKVDNRIKGNNFIFYYDGKRIPYEQKTEIAIADGFKNGFLEMACWFEKTHGLPFEGQLIKW